MTIKLDQPKEITIREAEKVTTDSIFINQITDNGTQVEALITIGGNTINGKVKTIILWDEQSTPTYTEIGQWTDTDVQERIKQLIN